MSEAKKKVPRRHKASHIMGSPLPRIPKDIVDSEAYARGEGRLNPEIQNPTTLRAVSGIKPRLDVRRIPLGLVDNPIYAYERGAYESRHVRTMRLCACGLLYLSVPLLLLASPYFPAGMEYETYYVILAAMHMFIWVSCAAYSVWMSTLYHGAGTDSLLRDLYLSLMHSQEIGEGIIRARHSRALVLVLALAPFEALVLFFCCLLNPQPVQAVLITVLLAGFTLDVWLMMYININVGLYQVVRTGSEQRAHINIRFLNVVVFPLCFLLWAFTISRFISFVLGGQTYTIELTNSLSVPWADAWFMAGFIASRLIYVMCVRYGYGMKCGRNYRVYFDKWLKRRVRGEG